jgi:hypothetical protein
VPFQILGEISAVETIATGSGIREIARLRKLYGRGRWRKRKGIAEIRLANGNVVTAEITGMKPDTSARRNSRSNASCEDVMAKTAKRLVICLENSGYEASLERRKIYIALPDARAEKVGQIRIIDESGEDYLYDKNAFLEVSLPQSARRAILLAA